MSLRRVVGGIGLISPDAPENGKGVVFTLVPGSYTATTQYYQQKVTAPVIEGEIDIELWANEEGVDASEYVCTLPSGEMFRFTLPPNAAPVELSTLRELGVGATTPQGESVLAIMEAQFAVAFAAEEANIVSQAAASVLASMAATIEAAEDATADAEAATEAALEATTEADAAATAADLAAAAAGDAADAANDAADAATLAADAANAAAVVANSLLIPLWISYRPIASDKLYQTLVRLAFTLPANMAGSGLKADTAATAQYVFTVTKNGVTVGTITVAAAGTTATFATTGGAPVAFAAGDLFAIVGSATIDATLAGISLTILVQFAP